MVLHHLKQFLNDFDRICMLLYEFMAKNKTKTRPFIASPLCSSTRSSSFWPIGLPLLSTVQQATACCQRVHEPEPTGQNQRVSIQLEKGVEATDLFYVPNVPPLLNGEFRPYYCLWREYMQPVRCQPAHGLGFGCFPMPLGRGGCQ